MIEKSQITWEEERGRMRRVANNVILHLHPTRVPAGALRFSYTWGLGGISALLVTMQLVTGVLLMFRYEPTVARAYASIQILETEVAFGSLYRAVHHWSANLLAITVFLHLLRVLFTGGFKRGRGLNWVIGLGLFLIVVAFNFTGYLLPWDQLAYWAITVATNLMAYLPLIGRSLSSFLLAGPEVGQGALSNFYAIHVAVLPLLLLALLTYHFWRIRKDGGISRPLLQEKQRLQAVTTIPHLVQREAAVLAFVLTAVTLWAMFVPAPLGALADPTLSPNPAKAAWYFLGFQELLLHMDALAAAVLVLLVIMGLALLPRWDRREDNIAVYFRSPRGRRAALWGTLLSFYLVPLLVVADEFWLDLPMLFPAWPILVVNGMIPLLLSLLGLAFIYTGLRLLLKSNHSEALTGLFAFLMVSLVVLTLIGIYFRGPNMALVSPF